MLSEKQFRISPLPTIVFGVGCSAGVGDQVKKLKKTRALVVTDPGLVKAKVVEPIADALGAAGLEVRIFDGVEANPTDQNVAAGAEELRALGDAVVVAVGGGSAMDAAKAIALVGANEGPVGAFAFGCRPEVLARPIVAVPTTAGTGAETNMFGVITDSQASKKIYIAHPSTQPRVNLLDPKLTVGLPKYPTATCGIDVLTHAVEAVVSSHSGPYSDAVGLRAIRTVARYLPRVYADGSDLEARSQMLLASNMAAIAFNVAGLGACHGTGHPLSARFGAAHGQTLATMLPHVMRFNMDAAEDKYAEIGEALGVARSDRSQRANAEAAVEAVLDLRQQVGTDKCAKELGVTEDVLPKLAEDALSDIVMMTNPKPVSAEDIIGLYRAALG